MPWLLWKPAPSFPHLEVVVVIVMVVAIGQLELERLF